MTTQPSADFLKKLMATFLVEAREHVQALGVGLLELGRTAGGEAQLPLIETLFREAHSLKGAARAVNAGEIEGLCQAIESTFADAKTGTRAVSAEALEELHRSVTVLGQLVERMAECGTGKAEGIERGTREAERGREETAPTSGVQSPGPPRSAFRVPLPDAPSPTADTVRIATSKLDAIFVQAEELLGVKAAQAEHALALRALTGLVAERDRLWAEAQTLVRGLRQQLDAGAGSVPVELPARLLDVLAQDREHADAIGALITELARAMADHSRRFDALVDRLLEDAKRALMLPFATILAGFPKMVHDLAQDAGKDVAFDMRGTDTEIDKRILERIKDPLVHLVRNSVDHGIEPPAERTRRGKPPHGSMMLAITQAGGKVEIQVTDDGAGIDMAAVKAAAVRAGVTAAGDAAALRDEDAMQLVFGSGVTTSRQVTAVSGRGLGMAIVEESVTGLGGTVSIGSTAGAGTTVRIGLPLTLATLRGTLVRVANHEFIVPTVNVARVVRIEQASVHPVENRDSICLDGVTLALVRLAEMLGLAPGPTAGGSRAPLTVLVLEHGQTRIAVAVDQVMGEQEVLAKPLGRLLVRVPNLAGGSVTGTGRVLPVLSVPDLLQTAAGCAQTAGPGSGSDTAPGVRVRRLLVVDDSITARTLLRSILESAGFDVKAAPDGAVALAALRTEPFDLVVSDVEMPRMDGFELTKRIRAEPKLAELPVVLVTAREAKEDRERGIDAGANAYIVKSSFDQSNLLEVIGRLI